MSRARDIANQGAGTFGSVTADDLTVDTTTLVVDEANNRVGIGTSSPSKELHVNGETLIEGAGTTLGGILNLENNTGTDHTWRLGVGGGDNAFVAGRGLLFRDETNAGNYMSIDTGGAVRIGTTTLGGANRLIVYGDEPPMVVNVENATGSYKTAINLYGAGNGAGSIQVTTSATAYNTSSDYRLKENVVDMTGAIDRVKALNPSRFNFIIDPNKTVDGFLAHEVQDVVPEAISGEKDAVEVWKEGEELPEGVSVGDNKLDEDGNTVPAYQGIDQSKLVPLLTGALKEAITEIESLKARVEALENA